MRALLTRNEDIESDHVNGSPGYVVDIEMNDDDDPIVIRFQPDSAAATTSPLRITRKTARVTCKGAGSVTRYQFPLLPAFAVTVHRVQGSTLDCDIHVLLNAEFFAAGQAYTALSRARRLSQLHLWNFDLGAIKAEPRIAREYARLARRPLTQAHVNAACSRPAAPLPTLSGIAAPHPASFEAYR